MNHLDAEFVRAFEACELPPEEFHHRDHIRLALIYCRESGPAAAGRIAASIRRYAAHLGKSEKYHETITQAWMHLVDRAVRSSPSASGFDEIVMRFPDLLDQNYLAEFYSQATLATPEARNGFVPPDRKPLP